MAGFLLRRAVQALIVIIGVILVVFLLSQLIPGGECKAVLGPKATMHNCLRFNRLNGFGSATCSRKDAIGSMPMRVCRPQDAV